MLSRMVAVLAPEAAEALASASESASRVPQPTLAAMAERTLAHYDAIVAARRRALRHDAGVRMVARFEMRRRGHERRAVAPTRERHPTAGEPLTAASESADWLARGRTHQWEGRPVDAMLCFRRASRADPRAPDPLFVLGEVLWQFGRVPDAVASWREAVRLDAQVSRGVAGACRSFACDRRREGRARGRRARAWPRAR